MRGPPRRRRGPRSASSSISSCLDRVEGEELEAKEVRLGGEALHLRAVENRPGEHGVAVLKLVRQCGKRRDEDVALAAENDPVAAVMVSSARHAARVRTTRRIVITSITNPLGDLLHASDEAERA